MLSDGELDRAASQLDDFVKRNTLSSILDSYKILLEDYHRLKSDFEEERDSREKYKRTVRDHERNPFVLVLVDGDGYIFDDNLITRRGDGGSEAAQRLNDEIRASLQRKGLEHCQIMIRVYANVAGLSKALATVFLVGNESRALSPFIASFNRTYDLTEFVDAGQLKENADFKLRGMLRLYANSAQCKHIYFAGCHDVGYISELTPYLSNSDKFTLVNTSGIRFHEEFTKLGMNIENISGAFRSTPLDTAKTYRPTTAAVRTITGVIPAPASPTKSTTVSPDDKKAICVFHMNGTCRYGKACKRLHVNDQTDIKQSWNDAPSEVQSEAGGVSLRPAPLSTNGDRFPRPATKSAISSLPSKMDIPKDHIAVNRNNHRLDPYIAELDLNVTAQLRARIGHKRVCNSFHLTGHCTAGENCQYDHTPVEGPTLLALEALARSQPCPKRGACRKLGCTNGHVCQVWECKQRGGKLYCRIAYSAHSEDYATARYVPGIVMKQAGDEPELLGGNRHGENVRGDGSGTDNKDGSAEDGSVEEESIKDGSTVAESPVGAHIALSVGGLSLLD